MGTIEIIAGVVFFLAALAVIPSTIGLLVQAVRGRPKRRWEIALAASIGLAIVAAITGGISDAEAAATDGKTGAPVDPSQRPSGASGRSAQEFAAAMEKFRLEYYAAGNEILKSKVFSDARAYEERYFAEVGQQVAGLEGWVEKLETNHGGTKLSLRIAIGKRDGMKVTFQQGYGLFDKIKSGTTVYAGATSLRESGCVRFSGRVKSREKSITEKGAVTAPEFKIEFSSVEACPASAEPAASAAPVQPPAATEFDPIGTQKRWDQMLVTLKHASVRNTTASVALVMQNLSEKEETISSLLQFEALSEEGDQGQMDWHTSKCDGTVPPKGVFKCKLAYKFETTPKALSLRVGAGMLVSAVYFKVQASK